MKYDEYNKYIGEYLNSNIYLDRKYQIYLNHKKFAVPEEKP